MAIMKNETLMVDEWIDHYLAQGASCIFLIDNGSTDDTVAKVERWKADGRVELVQLPQQHRQTAHYWTAFQHFDIGNRCEWLTVVDLDEFWFSKTTETLADYLDTQSSVDAIYGNWTVFGTDLVEHPQSVRLALTMRDPRLSRFTKCIFRTWLPRQENDIEVHAIRNVGLNRAKVDNSQLQLNHYVTKSREYWDSVKMQRGDAFFAQQDLTELAARFDAFNTASTSRCTLLRDRVSAGSPKA